MSEIVVADTGQERLKPMYVRRSVGGDILDLEPINGDLRFLYDYRGHVPRPPAPAYHQTIDGKDWMALSSDDVVWVRIP